LTGGEVNFLEVTGRLLNKQLPAIPHDRCELDPDVSRKVGTMRDPHSAVRQETHARIVAPDLERLEAPTRSRLKFPAC
jgi:hypothetical protein